MPVHSQTTGRQSPTIAESMVGLYTTLEELEELCTVACEQMLFPFRRAACHRALRDCAAKLTRCEATYGSFRHRLSDDGRQRLDAKVARLRRNITAQSDLLWQLSPP